MSYPIAAPAGSGGRPRIVTIARVLTFTIAVLLVIAGAAFVASVLSLTATVSGGNSDQLSSDQVNQGLKVLGAVGGVGILVLVAGQLTAGFLLGRASSNAGRVTAWIFDGVTLLCCGCGLATSFINNAGMNNTTSNGQSVTINTGQNTTALGVVVAGATGVALLAAMAVIILLVLPDSSDYFRRTPTVWSPGQQWPAQQPAYGAPAGWQPPQYGQPAGSPPAYGQPPTPPGALPPAPPAPGSVPPVPQPPFTAPPPAPPHPTEGRPPTWGPPPSAPPNPYGPNDPTAPPSEQR